MERLIATHLLAGAARRLGLDSDPRFQQMVAGFERRDVIKLVREEIVQREGLDDAGVRREYEAHRASFTAPERRQVQQIVVHSRAEAEEILAILRSPPAGVSFYTLARDRSIDPNAKQTLGVVGWVARTDGDPVLSDVAFSLAPGEISRPIQTGAGFHLVRVIAVQARGSRSPRRRYARADPCPLECQSHPRLCRPPGQREVPGGALPGRLPDASRHCRPGRAQLKTSACARDRNKVGSRSLGRRCSHWAAVLLGASLLSCGAAQPPGVAGAPPRDYAILVHSELGMHCTGFDFTYCCVLPPYNSVLAQIVRTDAGSGPRLLQADPQDAEVLLDGARRIKLAYKHEDAQGLPNTHSEHQKMVYWGADYEGRTLASQEFRQLYLYDDLQGGNASGTTADAKKLRIGEAYPIKIDRGPTNQHVGHGFLRNSGPKGTVVFTDSPAMENVPIMLTMPNTWEALGLPLTPFNDYVSSAFFLEESDVRPFQRAVVSLIDAGDGKPVLGRDGRPVSGFGVNAIDVPACDRCHATDNANGTRYRKYRTEYDFWRHQMQTGEWFARLKATAVSILEIHDAKHGTSFTARYPTGGTLTTRLGHDSVRCQDCHADNVVGVLVSRRIRDVPRQERGARFAQLNPDPNRIIPPLTEAIHLVHQRNRPLPDSLGYTGTCQGCHPAHRDDGNLAGFPLTHEATNPYASSDNRNSAGGCFIGRDVHSNARRDDDVPTPSHLNAVGTWLRDNVMRSPDGTPKGLTCTNCHNLLSRALYRTDHLTNAVRGEGTTLRGASLPEIASALGIDEQTLIRDYLDPRVPPSGPDRDSGVVRIWDRRGETVAPIAVLQANASGEAPILTQPDVDGDRSVMIASTDPLSGTPGVVAPYDAATNGKEYWLSPGEPHCADCHAPPFVESEGGAAFPIDQPGKYALMRFSTGHAGIHCQGCHSSSHGLEPVTPDVDTGTYAQAAFLNPDGTHGPVKCAACHRVNAAGVPLWLKGRSYRDRPLENDYDLAVEYSHTLR